jgi:esterase/lipase superfamily enzyme
VEQSERVTLYANDDDTALTAAMKVHFERRAGDANPPVVVPGIETVDCSRVDFSILGHDYYGNNADVLADLFSVIKEQKSAGQRPYLSSRKGNSRTARNTGSSPAARRRFCGRGISISRRTRPDAYHSVRQFRPIPLNISRCLARQLAR